MVSTHVWLKDAESIRSQVTVVFPDEVLPQEAVGFSAEITTRGGRATLHFSSVKDAQRLIRVLEEGVERYETKCQEYGNSKKRQVAGRRLKSS